ncbi:FAD dependent oxidoreductase [Lecanosticta acicola]|uniref:FAD dependent oxidoreductase n=1 Tax=Lecanosticta acicola TaxID=111012 RepID=A0AAI8Z422_9PEZI|nr:FAD dependent oxidoreductase [Lecanosticta acicola]
MDTDRRPIRAALFRSVIADQDIPSCRKVDHSRTTTDQDPLCRPPFLNMITDHDMDNIAESRENPCQTQFDYSTATSGSTAPVWVHKNPYTSRLRFPRLSRDLEGEVVIIGAGIAGVQTAYELVSKGRSVVLLEGRRILSGETGRTCGQLTTAMPDGYADLIEKHGDGVARMAAESHHWAINRVHQLQGKHGIPCEFRYLPLYRFNHIRPGGDPEEYQQELYKSRQKMQHEYEAARDLGLNVELREGVNIKGWDCQPDQRDCLVFHDQAAFHPTSYLNGILKWLSEQPNFKAFAYTRVTGVVEKKRGIGRLGGKNVEIKTEIGHTVNCEEVVLATGVPLHRESIVARMEYMRMYCIAVKVPRGIPEDCLVCEMDREYKCMRLTECDGENFYLIVGESDRKCYEGKPVDRFKELETWTRERFPKAGSVDYAWMGQQFEPSDRMGSDRMGFVGRDPGTQHTWIIAGNSGNGLTHGVIAGELLAHEMKGKGNPRNKRKFGGKDKYRDKDKDKDKCKDQSKGHAWSALYKPERFISEAPAEEANDSWMRKFDYFVKSFGRTL